MAVRSTWRTPGASRLHRGDGLFGDLQRGPQEAQLVGGLDQLGRADHSSALPAAGEEASWLRRIDPELVDGTPPAAGTSPAKSGEGRRTLVELEVGGPVHVVRRAGPVRGASSGNGEQVRPVVGQRRPPPAAPCWREPGVAQGPAGAGGIDTLLLPSRTSASTPWSAMAVGQLGPGRALHPAQVGPGRGVGDGHIAGRPRKSSTLRLTIATASSGPPRPPPRQRPPGVPEGALDVGEVRGPHDAAQADAIDHSRPSGSTMKAGVHVVSQ